LAGAGCVGPDMIVFIEGISAKRLDDKNEKEFLDAVGRQLTA
jgi:hypothetical protein